MGSARPHRPEEDVEGKYWVAARGDPPRMSHLIAGSWGETRNNSSPVFFGEYLELSAVRAQRPWPPFPSSSADLNLCPSRPAIHHSNRLSNEELT